jgi:hypothetical protein
LAGLVHRFTDKEIRIMRSAPIYLAMLIAGLGSAAPARPADRPVHPALSSAGARHAPRAFAGRRVAQGRDAGIMCEGFAHEALGAAELACNGDGTLTVSNIGSSGEDGVSIELGDVAFFSADLPGLDAAPVGATITAHLAGTKDYGSPQPLGNVQLMRGDGSWQMFADMTPIGIDTYSVAVFDDGAYVGSLPVGPGEVVEFLGTPLGMNLGGGGGASTLQEDPGCPPPFTKFWYCRMPDGSPKQGCPAFYSPTLFGHPLGTTLANCCNPWPGCGNPPCPFVDYRCRIQYFVSFEFADAGILVGGDELEGDVAVVTAELLDGAIRPIQTTILGADLPEIVLGEETVGFSQIGHGALGEAELEVAADHLTISNIGSSGEDGVSIDLSPTVKWSAGFDPNTSGGTIGAALEASVSGDVDGTVDAPIGTAAYEVSAADVIDFEADLSPLGVDGYTIEVFNDGSSVLEVPGMPSGQVTVSSLNGLAPRPDRLCAAVDGVSTSIELGVYDEDGNVLFSGPFGAVEGDTVRITGEDPTAVAEQLGGIDLRLADFPMFSLMGEGRVDIASDWCDDFDLYAEDYLVGQGPWNPWNDDQNAADFQVTSVQSRSAPYSLAIDGEDDAVHQFMGYTSGVWELSAWTYVPAAMDDSQYFVLLNTYPADIADASNWSLQLEIDGGAGVIADNNGSDTLPLIRDDWVEIRVVIDLDADTQSVFYGGDLLVAKSWTAGVQAGGASNIAAVDLWGASSASMVFYDDVCIAAGAGPGNPADFDGDGDVDTADLLHLLACWGSPCGDVDGDGDTDTADLLALLAAWGD